MEPDGAVRDADGSELRGDFQPARRPAASPTVRMHRGPRMSMTGRSSGDAWIASRTSCTCTSSVQLVGGPRAGASGGGSRGSPGYVRLFRIGAGSVMKAMSRMSPPQAGHASGKSSAIFSMSLAQAIREVSWERLAASGAPSPRRSPRGRGGGDAAPARAVALAMASDVTAGRRG